MSAPSALVELVRRFRENRETYQPAEFHETALRLQFIDPMFELLGWDVHNRQGYAEAYKDVAHEDSLKIGASTKTPDYSFRIGGVRKFFVEAQRPSVNIKHDPGPAYQLRRYAWSAKLPLSILTDFEEFAVYDCRVRPARTDKPGTARIMYLTFEQYEERWDEIAAVFSREAVLKGSFDRYSESAKKKRGTEEVDAAFLKEIETWRSELARLFRDADDRYNSGLFHFSPERGRVEVPDEWTLNLTLDDRVIKEIIRKLYYPESPYEFSVLPADILGQVYEQFLGKVIRLTAGHRAVVEDKTEVKKAGGVYYTPTYIVQHIVQHTVGKLLEKKTAYEAAARPGTRTASIRADRASSV